MKQLYKFSSNFFLKGVVALVIICAQTWKTAASESQKPEIRRLLTNPDTTRPGISTDTNRIPPIVISDTSRLPDTDTTFTTPRIDTFRLKLSSDTLDAPLRYAAIDSVVVLIKDKKILMYGQTRTEYKDITLTAPELQVDQETQTVTAVNRVDSLGLAIENPTFKDGSNQFTSDTIRYNFKTGVGLTKNTYTQQDEMFVFGQLAKKVNTNTTFIKGARFTTCNLDDPHFAFVTNKMKVITQKVAISGPTHPDFE